MKRRMSIIVTVGIILLAALLLYEYLDGRSHQAETDRGLDSSSMPDATQTPASGSNETPLDEEAWAKAMEGVKVQEIEKISTFVQGKECFSSNQKMIGRVKKMLSRLTRKEQTMSTDVYEGGWTVYHAYGRDGVLYTIDMLNAEGRAVVYIKQGKQTLCCDISRSDEKFLHELNGKFYDKFAVDEEDE